VVGYITQSYRINLPSLRIENRQKMFAPIIRRDLSLVPTGWVRCETATPPMSEMDPSRQFGCLPVTSSLPPTPDMALHRNKRRDVPTTVMLVAAFRAYDR
jgi:hypothetical protein